MDWVFFLNKGPKVEEFGLSKHETRGHRHRRSARLGRRRGLRGNGTSVEIAWENESAPLIRPQWLNEVIMSELDSRRRSTQFPPGSSEMFRSKMLPSKGKVIGALSEIFSREALVCAPPEWNSIFQACRLDLVVARPNTAQWKMALI